MSDLINAVKRLGRVGGEHSRATEKLHEAARTVAAVIKEQVPRHVMLPRGYCNYGLEHWSGYDGHGQLLVKYSPKREGEKPQIQFWIDSGSDWTEQTEEYQVRFNILPQSRKGSLEFAKDVAEGLLDEIAVFLETRAQEAERAASVLESNIPA